MIQETSVHTSYIDWATIIAGAVVACAISTVLLQFGAAIGIAGMEPGLSADANIIPGVALGAGIWVLWIQVLSTLAGAYLAGRMRMPIAGASEHERDMRDGVHGLLVWALATVAVVVAASIAASIAALADNPAEDAARIADLSRTEKNSQVIFAFSAAATSLATAVLAWWAATMGGDHRDTQTDHTRYFTFRAIR
jgi:hypothetical protein